MNVNFQQAVACFQEAVGLIDQHQNPALWDIANGLWAVAQGLQDLDARVAALEHHLGNK